jgi:hypothetical protein
MELAKKIEGTRQAGAEFLTWLVYRSVVSEGMVQTSLGPVEMWPENKVTLVSPYAGGEVNIVKGDAPAQGREVAAALLKGKHIEEAKLSVNFGGKRWDFTFNGPAFSLSSVKVPAVLGDTDIENVLDRFELLGTLEEIVGSLYDNFLEIRMDSERWAEEVRAFEDWLTTLAQEAT